MSIILKEGVDNSNGRLEFYLTGLELPRDFDSVIQTLKDIKNLHAVETVNGIFSRIGKFEIGDMHFSVVYHEDVGVYAFSPDNTNQTSEKLRDLLTDVVEEMNRNTQLDQ